METFGSGLFCLGIFPIVGIGLLFVLRTIAVERTQLDNGNPPPRANLREAILGGAIGIGANIAANFLMSTYLMQEFHGDEIEIVGWYIALMLILSPFFGGFLGFIAAFFGTNKINEISGGRISLTLGSIIAGGVTGLISAFLCFFYWFVILFPQP